MGRFSATAAASALGDMQQTEAFETVSKQAEELAAELA